MGFANLGGVCQSFMIPGSTSTRAWAINNLGQVVGYRPDRESSLTESSAAEFGCPR